MIFSLTLLDHQPFYFEFTNSSCEGMGSIAKAHLFPPSGNHVKVANKIYDWMKTRLRIIYGSSDL